MTEENGLCLNCGGYTFLYWYNPISDEGFCEDCYKAEPKSKLLNRATGI